MSSANVKMPTREEILRWAPKAKTQYVDALVVGEPYLAEAGILESPLTLCHFMAQVGGETNGLTVLREDMNYLSVERIRKIWPARARKYSDTWIQSNLVRNPKRLAGWAYGGRMGNEPWPSLDGYDYRGGGWIQTTGRYAVEKYCKRLGVAPHPGILDDFVTTLRFACMEWKESGCQTYACANDIFSVSKIINTGSAKSGVVPNGMEHRRHWFKQAWAVWGDERRTIPAATGITAKTLKEAGSETISTADALKAVSLVGGTVSAVTGAARNAQETGVADPGVSFATPPADPSLIDQMRQATESADAVAAFATAMKAALTVATSNLWVFGLLCGVAGYMAARKIIERRVADARLGLNAGRVPEAP